MNINDFLSQNPNAKIGDVIKYVREQENISQRELARETKIDNAAISRIEDGTTKKPNVDIIYKICSALKINFIQMLSLANYSKLEIFELTNIGLELSFDIRVTSILEKSEFKNYMIENDVGVFLDIGKILDHYKNNDISYEKAVQLIHLCQPLYMDDGTSYYFSSKGDVEIDCDF